MRIKLIEDLPMATSAELYQLSWAIEKLLADPRRVVQARRELHMGQQVKCISPTKAVLDTSFPTMRSVRLRRQ